MTRMDRSSGSIAGHRVVNANDPQPGLKQNSIESDLKSMIKEAMALAKSHKKRSCWLYLKLAYVAFNDPDDRKC